MSESPRLLEPKLFVPPSAADTVARARLVTRIEEGLRRRLTLLSAPAGSGKTTLLAAWHATPGGKRWPVAWVSLGADDNEPGRFWTYVCTAVGRALPGVGEAALELLCSGSPTPPEVVLSTLINDLARADQPLAIVLDDYHEIHLATVHEGLRFLLEYLPPTVHIVLATRADPPLPLARLRANGQLLELRAAELRFTLEEATTFLVRSMRLDLSPEAIAVLAERTEGWAVGLQLAGLALQAHADRQAFVHGLAGTHWYLVDYLVDEVLRQQPPEIQEFLLDSAILDRLTGPLCAAVTGRDDAARVLKRLLETNLFLLPLDDERRWYRYHQLFADVLRHHLERTRPGSIAELHRRAAGWFHEHALTSDAVHHALLSRDPSLAAQLIEDAAGGLVARGEMGSLLEWVSRLPEEVTRARPRLGLAHAWALVFTNQLDAAEQRATRVERALAEDRSPELTAELIAVRAAIASGRREISNTLRLSREALSALPATHVQRSSLTLNLAYAAVEQGYAREALGAFAEAARAGESGHNPLTTCIALVNLGQLEAGQGHLHRAVAQYRRALEVAERSAATAARIRAIAALGLGGVLCEWNQLADSEQHLDEAAVHGAHLGPVFQFSVDLALARLRRARDDFAGALQRLDTAEQRLSTGDFRLWKLRLDALRARVEVSRGNLSAAAAWANTCALTQPEPSWPTYLMQRLTVVRVWIAEARAAEALALLGELASAIQSGRLGNPTEVLLLQALAMQAAGDADASAVLTRSLLLAQPEGHIRLFVDEGTPVLRLLRSVRRAQPGILSEYLDRLLGTEAAASSQSAPGAEALTEQLSERELQVLRMIAAGASNADIARELVLEVGTVKTHINNLYRKLDVHSRTQAVARASQLRLLPAP